MGLVDEISNEDNLRQDSISFAKKIVSENRPLVKISEMNDKVEAARGNENIFKDFRTSIARKARGFLAPEYIFNVSKPL